jgi:predicted transcriptional regulator of viral defense system
MASRIGILDDLVADGREWFTSASLRVQLGLSPQATSNLLSRWVRDGLVDRVSRGRYVVRPLGSLGTRAASQDIALAVAAAFDGVPHRIAYRSALDHHGLLTHPARTIQVATPRLRRIRTISGRKLRIMTELESTLDIGAERAHAGAMVSGHLRSLLDAAARPDLGGGPSVLAEALTTRPVHPDELTQLARSLEANAALRRIGSIADRLGLAGLAGQLQPLSPPRSDIELDPRDPHRAFRDTAWWVTWPITREELAGSKSHPQAVHA